MNTHETSVLPTPDAARQEIGTLVDLLETERARIARELHDSLCQKVALVRIELDRIIRTLPTHDRTQLRRLSMKVADIAQELHEVSYELHPLRLESLGLAKSLEALCRETSRQSGVGIAFVCRADLPDQIGAGESLCLYRVAQEALHNVVTHSGAARARVELACIHDALELVVADEGQGFDTSAASNGLGLTSIRQRVELLNGTIAIATRKGAGTQICVRIPFR